MDTVLHASYVAESMEESITKHSMVRINRILFAGIVAATLGVAVAGAADLPLGNGKQFAFDLPPDARIQIRKPPIPSLPASARISSGSAAVMLTPIRYDQQRLKTRVDLDRMLKLMTRKYVAGSVEQTLKIRRIKDKESAYGSFTDASLIGKPDTPGNWKCVTTGMLKRDTYLISFSLFTHSLDQKRLDPFLKVLEGGRFVNRL